jgi:BMFP domain-containing protein YqiC
LLRFVKGAISCPFTAHPEDPMQTDNRILDDIARVASGALNALGGVKDEIETRVRERLERLAAEMELATREEVDAAKGMAAKARTVQEQLEARVAALEAEVAALKAAKPARAPRPAAPRKKKAAPAAD